MADPAVNPIGAAPVAIAHVVLRRYQAAREEKNSNLKDDMSLMKLIKIAYAAHGYHLAFYNTPLVRQRIEAWPNGPVIRDIFYCAKALGSSGSRPLRQNLFWLPARYLNPFEGFVAKKSREVVDSVIHAFGANSDRALSAATHRDGTPWQQTYEKGQFNPISNKVIRDFYVARHKAADVSSKGL